MTASPPVTARIREDLSSGHLRSGQKILQEQLAARYGVSRIPLREALNELQAEGLVVHEPNRGYFVAELRAADMREVYRLRELLEAEAIKATMENLRKVSDNLVAYNANITRILQNADSISSVLANGDLKRMMADLNASSAQLKEIMSGLKEGEGSLGALLTNDTLYANLESASRELDMLIEDLRINPNRYVHLSLFGKKDRLPKLSDSDIDRIQRAMKEEGK